MMTELFELSEPVADSVKTHPMGKVFVIFALHNV